MKAIKKVIIVIIFNLFVSFLSASSYEWTKSLGSINSEKGKTVKTDNAGNIYIAGDYRDTINFAEDWGSTDIKTNRGVNNSFIMKINNDGTYGWTKTIRGVDYDQINNLSIDNMNNIYFISTVRKSIVNFAEDWGGNDLKTNSGGSSVTITKINNDGTYGWTKVVHDTTISGGICITIDDSRNIYLTGLCYGIMNFAGDWGGVDNKTNFGKSDAFIMKINNDGTYGWTKIIGGPGKDAGTSITTDDIGNIYVTGYIASNMLKNFAEDWGGVDYKNCNGIEDMFITKINNDGSYGWSKIIGMPSFITNARGNGIVTDNDNNIFISGRCGAQINYAADWGGTDIKTNYSGSIALIKINNDGTYGWTKILIGGFRLNEFNNMSIDAYNNIYIVGNCMGDLNFATNWNKDDIKYSYGNTDIFMTKINSDGSYGYSKRIGGLDIDYGKGVTIDKNGYIYIIAEYQDTVNFADDWGGVDNKNCNGIWDVSITKLLSRPNDVTSLISTAISTNMIVLNWNDVLNETRYLIYRSSSNDFASSAFITSLSSNINNYTNQNLSPGTKYHYWVVSSNSTWSTISPFPSTTSNYTYSGALYFGPFYVATNGSDTNNGSFMNPFATIQKAGDVMSGGLPACTTATCYIFPGTYSETVMINANNNSGYMVITKLSNQQPVLTGSLSSNTGIIIFNADKVIINGLTVYKFSNFGIRITGDSESNIIVNNTIYSNEIVGVGIVTEAADNNYILSNTIYGRNQHYGIFIQDCDKNVVRSNQIYGNQIGIRLHINTTSNKIINNLIYSNSDAGISIGSDDSDNNFIISNKIWGLNQSYGIMIGDADNNKIYYNLIINNEIQGLHISGNAENIEIINNTIFKNDISNGVGWRDTSGGMMYNNIILSNGDGPTDYGIRNFGTGNVFVAYNNIYGNFEGPTNGNLIIGNGNIFNDPMIETVTSFTISSIFSPPLNSGTNIPGISDVFIGTGPDMGWKESSFISNIIILPPEKPFGLTANAVSPNQIDIIWNDLFNETSYTLFRSTNNNTNSAINIAGFTNNQANDTGLSPDTIYYYWVKAYNAIGSSGYSIVAYDKTKPTGDPFKGGIVKIGPTTIFNNEKLYFANVTRDTKVSIYDVKGRLLWSADVTDSSKCIQQGGYLYIKPEVIEDLADGLYIIAFKDNKYDPQIKKFNKISRDRR